VNLAMGINSSTYKKIGTRKYCINNNLVIWNWLATKTGVKFEKIEDSTKIVIIKKCLHFIV
jgi:hypothetical protein